jgi:glycosyltransferase involved in cell wall biosynthesis
MRNILYLGNKLSKHGFSVTGIETLGKQLEEEGFQVWYSSDKRNIAFRLVDMLFSILKYRSVIDLVIMDTYSKKAFYYSYFCSLLCRLLKINYYPVLRGGNLPEKIRQSKRMAGAVFGHSKANIAPSFYLFNVFSDAGFNVEYIPNNINLKDYDFKERSSFSPLLLWVRSFDNIYNPVLAIEILKVLLDNDPGARLCMVGPDKDGSQRFCRDRANELGILDHVTFTGYLSKKEWHTLAADYDIFLNTTTVDNTPVSVIEAMALGLPVVSTNVGGIPYLLQDEVDCLLVQNGDGDAMVRSIIRLIDYPEIGKDIAFNAREKVSSFDWDVVRHQWTELLVNGNLK